MWLAAFWNWLLGRSEGRAEHRNGARYAREVVEENTDQTEQVHEAMRDISRAPDPFTALMTTIWNERQWDDNDPESNS